MKTVVRACIKPGMRDALTEAVRGPDCPPVLRKAFAQGRYEGDICYFTLGGLLGNPWPQVKPWVERYFDIEWEMPPQRIDPLERSRIGKLHTLRVKLGMGH
jgi:hypothetical protein